MAPEQAIASPTWNKEAIVAHSEAIFKGHGDLELYYQCWRPDTRPKAVLAVVHGHGEHSGRYGNVVDWFVPRGYAVYAFDLRGHGRSAGKRGYIESFAEYRRDAGAFLDLVHREEPDLELFLLGHSQGGLIALNYALHDGAGLAGVVASGPVLSPPGISPFLIQLSKLLSNVWPGLTLETGMDTTALSRDSAVVKAYVEDPLVHAKGTPRLGAEMLVAVDWTQAHAVEMALPCLIVHGGADRLCPPEASRRFFENVTFADIERIEYEGYYHEVFNEPGKEKVLADVEAWLERHS
jgi:alpha-beta hydrolase superfamily lysophospholipase